MNGLIFLGFIAVTGFIYGLCAGCGKNRSFSGMLRDVFHIFFPE